MSTDREVEWKQEGETSKCSVQWRNARINNHIIKRKDSVTQVKNRFCICSSSGPVWMIFIDRWCQIKVSLGFKFLTYLLTNHTCTSWCFFLVVTLHGDSDPSERSVVYFRLHYDGRRPLMFSRDSGTSPVRHTQRRRGAKHSEKHG